jgi:DnaJ domain
MQAFLLGMVLLFITLWGLNRYTQANPAALSRRLTKSWGYTSLIVGAILTLRGGAALGIPLATFGAWLLGWGPGSSMGSPTPTLGQSTSVTTDYLEMQIDHDSGAMSGRVIKGLFAGRTLESLRPVEVAHLWADCRFQDPESARILEAYLDRIHPNWRQDMADGEAEMTTSRGGRMRRDEALEILGLQEGATADDIRQAHRELMKKIHPDRGGSTYLATKINEAKDVLLG